MGIMAQIGIVLAVCLVGEGIAALLPIPFPASVISMVLLFLLLAAKLLRPHHIKEKSNFLITNMACFFVPAGVGILRYADVLWANLLPLLAICFITTPLVYVRCEPGWRQTYGIYWVADATILQLSLRNPII